MNGNLFTPLRNGQVLEEEKIPVLGTVNAFTEYLGLAMAEGFRLAAYFGRRIDGQVKLYALLADDEDGRLWMGAAYASESFPSLASRFPQSHLFEREIHEQFGLLPVGHPWLKSVRLGAPDATSFFRMDGDEVHEVAVGPVHAGIIEPGHFRFQCHGENVFHLEIQLGYQHRGVESLLETLPFSRVPFVVDSIAGDTTLGHSLAWAMGWESLGGARVSARAEALRAVALELERLANHTGDLGAMSGDVAFLPSASYFGRLRGDFLNMLLELTGARLGRGFLRPGGVTDDLPAGMAEEFGKRLKVLRRDLRDAAGLFFETPSVSARLEGTGILTPETCRDLGLVGPVARACGLARDVRQDHPFGYYRFNHPPTVTVEGGDVYARAMVRWLEIERSLDFVSSQIESLPGGELRGECGPLAPDRVGVSLVEGWRGEILHVVMTDRDGKIARYKVKDPSFHNWTGLSQSLRGQSVSDFPLINKSFNLSYAGHDL